jgi:hypothetical protein
MKSTEPIPLHQAIVYHNDCMYIAHYCYTALFTVNAFCALDAKESTSRFVGAFQNIAYKLFNQQLVRSSDLAAREGEFAGVYPKRTRV